MGQDLFLIILYTDEIVYGHVIIRVYHEQCWLTLYVEYSISSHNSFGKTEIVSKLLLYCLYTSVGSNELTSIVAISIGLLRLYTEVHWYDFLLNEVQYLQYTEFRWNFIVDSITNSIMRKRNECLSEKLIHFYLKQLASYS